jgi:prolyl-tRNA synthetase
VITPAPEPGDPSSWPAMAAHDTPDTPTIETLVDLANAEKLAGRADWTAADTLKNVVVRVTRPHAEPEVLVVGVPGNREVDLKRLDAALHPGTATLFEAADFAAQPDLVRGYLGPQVLAELGIRYVVDPRIVTGTSWLTGANEPGRHATNVVCGRDFTPDATIEAADVRAGDPCPACGGPLTMRRGIEIGHIFQLGRRYADAFELDALGPDGKPIRITMGSYGVGVSRLVAAIAEQHHDGKGLIWPAVVAPADVHIVATGTGEQTPAALRLAAELTERGLDVLVDDRAGVSAGVKFTDAELIGVPTVVVVGRRLAEGQVELRRRAQSTREDVPIEDLAARL